MQAVDTHLCMHQDTLAPLAVGRHSMPMLLGGQLKDVNSLADH